MVHARQNENHGSHRCALLDLVAVCAALTMLAACSSADDLERNPERSTGDGERARGSLQEALGEVLSETVAPRSAPAGSKPPDGVQGALLAPEPGSLASPATVHYPLVEVGGIVAATTCSYAGEAMPVHSRNATTGDTRTWVPFQNIWAPSVPLAYSLAYNTATNWSAWGTQGNGLPPANDGGDPWSTTSSHTGLEYESTVASFSAFGHSFGCVAIGATSWTNLANSGGWTYPWRAPQ